MRFAAWYGISVGLGMFVQWGVFLLTGQVPELQSEPFRIAFHLGAEVITAVGLVAGGTALLKDASWAVPVYLVAIGMLFYSVIVSPGYFAQQGQWAFVVMFAVLFTLALVSTVSVVRALRV